MSSMASLEPAGGCPPATAELPVRIYSPDSPLRKPFTFLHDGWVDVSHSAELAWLLTIRDIKAQFRQSILGYLWAFLPPLVSALTFILLSKSGSFGVNDPGVPYSVFVIVGTLVWQVFADAVQGPLRAVAMGQNMLIKINFPREALIASGVGTAMFNCIVRLIILGPVLIYYGFWPSWEWLWAGAGFVGMMILGTCISTLLIPLSMLFYDIMKGIMLIMSFWMFLSAAIFPLPEEGKALQLMHLNPAMPLVVTTRNALLGLDISLAPQMLAITGVAFGVFLLSWLMYRLAMPHMIARLGM